MKRRKPKAKRSGRWSSGKVVLWILLLGGLLAGTLWLIRSPQSAKRVAHKPSGKTQTEVRPEPATPSNQNRLAGRNESAGHRPMPARLPRSAVQQEQVTIPATNSTGSDSFPRPVRDVLEAQIALARLGISSGSVDGRTGPQTRMALVAFQRAHRLPDTGQLDTATREALSLSRPLFSRYTLTDADLKRLQPLNKTWAGKAQQSALDYETALELVAERSRTHPEFLRRLNPPGLFDAPTAGTSVVVPDTEPDELTPCDFVRISLSQRTLEAFDSQSNLVAHFPCSIARRVEKRPAGELHVIAIAPNPNYTFDPDLFPESPEAHELSGKLVLPPGPNNPVGVAWIGLDLPGYGIHGTPSPEQVGRTESHGCFRLANWNAEHLLQIVQIGTPVYVDP